ncbi:MAG: hypothetical protein ACKOZV_12630, partial [Bacteroidota bacterium]
WKVHRAKFDPTRSSPGAKLPGLKGLPVSLSANARLKIYSLTGFSTEKPHESSTELFVAQRYRREGHFVNKMS